MSLARYALRRILVALPMLLAVTVLTFLLVRLAPGDPAYLLGGEGGSPAYYAMIRQKFGLDRPLPEQLVRYLTHVVRGDLGRSLQQGRPVLELIWERVPATLLLAGTAFLIATVAGVLLGVLAAVRPHGLLDRLILLGTGVGSVLPVFWTGLLLVLVFSIALGWFPVHGMTSPRPPSGWEAYRDVLHHLVLPVATLSVQPLSSFSRLMRVKMLEALREMYITTARAKGLPELRVLLHAARNALLPVVTVIGGYANTLVGGAVLTETVFAWPGLGRLALDATLSRDYPLILGVTLVGACGTVAINLATDLAYAVLDPRIRYG
jgi:peptide/nickel transport system permease protein